jgi:uncharacterized protein (DUF427 family)
MKIPGSDHPITITPAPKRWRARFAGQVVADSDHALILQEASYPAVVYFPREDVQMELMSRTDRGTHCPYKGDASYFTLNVDGQAAENAVWTYETPFPAMEAITERVAFYTDRIEVYEADDAEAAASPGPQDRKAIDDVIQHTDSGAGQSQREHWPASVEQPHGR